RAPARRNGGADHASGLRRAGRVEGALGRRFALFDRADAPWSPGRDAGDRAGGRGQRGAARGERGRGRRWRVGGAARKLAPAPDRGGARDARGRQILSGDGLFTLILLQARSMGSPRGRALAAIGGLRHIKDHTEPKGTTRAGSRP